MAVNSDCSVSSDVVVSAIQGTEFLVLQSQNQQVNHVRNVRRPLGSIFFFTDEQVHL